MTHTVISPLQAVIQDFSIEIRTEITDPILLRKLLILFLYILHRKQ